jgi:hypothetical protein
MPKRPSPAKLDVFLGIVCIGVVCAAAALIHHIAAPTLKAIAQSIPVVIRAALIVSISIIVSNAYRSK